MGADDDTGEDEGGGPDELSVDRDVRPRVGIDIEATIDREGGVEDNGLVGLSGNGKAMTA